MIELSAAQRNFLTFHVKRVVYRWEWFLQESNLRAVSGRRTATVTRLELDDLIAHDLMFKGAGCADVHPTAAGRALVDEEKEARSFQLHERLTPLLRK